MHFNKNQLFFSEISSLILGFLFYYDIFSEWKNKRKHLRKVAVDFCQLRIEGGQTFETSYC
jgi:hypothetical protein